MSDIHIPFSDFYIYSGQGTRQNDHRLNLQKIIACEINLISEPGKKTKGVILLDSLRTYK